MLAGPIQHTVKIDNRHAFEQQVIVRRFSNPAPLGYTVAEGEVSILVQGNLRFTGLE